MSDLALEPIWTILICAAGGAYLYVLSRVGKGLRRIEIRERAQTTDGSAPAGVTLPFVSVIIPARDEAEHIGGALEDLARQDYPEDHLEVIVIDDRSEDGTGEIARGYQGRIAALQVLRVDACPEGVSPKKHALQRGFDVARGDILITTDGDCRFHPGWITSLVGRFESRTGLVTGLTIFDRKQREPFWQRLQQLDYLSHSFLAAGAIGCGWAFNCNGSNLALRRVAFADVGGYSAFRQVVTGDDTLLLQRLKQSGRWKVTFSADPRSLVRSYPEETPGAVLQQRLRWGSGGVSYSRPALLFALDTFFFYLFLLFSPLFWLLGWVSPVFALFFALKIFAEGRVMSRGFSVFQLKPDWQAFVFLELIHIPAILGFSIGGHLWGFRWKGERFRRTRDACAVAAGTMKS
jgi:cellulose synthase/poly-beta-1,6-N-acetylglucosamine synthase-like glycosyltransferase